MPESAAIHYEQEELAKFSREVELENFEDEDDDSAKDIGELLGFRVTGGRDFFMPITIFHVKENSRAEKGNLKLGDSILSINGKATRDMTLVEANRFLAKVSGGDVTLQVAKFDGNDDDEDVQRIEEVVLEGPASLEQKLKMMQKQLLEMTDIPVQIQSKIAMVTRALEQFMTMDPEALESSLQRASTEESQEESNSEKQFSSIPEEIEGENDTGDVVNNNEPAEASSESFDHFDVELSTRETSYSYDDLEEQYQKLQEDNEERTDIGKSNDDEDDDDKSLSESLKSEELQRLEDEKRRKNEKIQKLQKSWQRLCSNTRTIHKRSNCHLVPSVALINNKITQLNESKVISFYERKRCPQND